MSTKQYSIWPVMVTPYNLPPWLCVKTRFIWLTILITGPSNPKKYLDIYLRPLIDDLVHCWNVGVDTYDASRSQSFTMREALMWTVSDFPAYAMLSGWSTQGKLGCPYCMDDTKTFVFKTGRKVSYFGCHRRFLPENHLYRGNTQNFYRDRTDFDGPIQFRSGHEVYDKVFDGFGVEHNWTKKSIFWELPYWMDVKLRHNLDVMHIEKNVFENLFNTIMDVKGKTKDDGVKCRKDIKFYCQRPELELKTCRGRFVANKGKYQLTREQQKLVLVWVKSLKFPDGFSSNLGNKVDLSTLKLVGYKSHNAHVFIERLMPIAFKGFLPKHIWEAISELYVACSATYKVNTYKFHIESHGEGRNTVNSHVYVQGTEGTHYYGVIEDIIHMRCRTNHRLKIVLFKCRWYDPQFVRSYPSNGIVIVNSHRPYPRYDPYILAQQAVQVYYVTFPGLAGQNNQGWVAICAVKPTNAIDMEVANFLFQDDGQIGAKMPVLVNEIGYVNLADDEVYEYSKEDGNDDHVADNPDTEDESDESS
ncbi:hypothetical protein QQ045_030706 [Rhodiola kirilowii]